MPENPQNYIYPESAFSMGRFDQNSGLYADLVNLEHSARLIRSFMMPEHSEPAVDTQYIGLYPDPLLAEVFRSYAAAELGYNVIFHQARTMSYEAESSGKGCHIVAFKDDASAVYQLVKPHIITPLGEVLTYIEEPSFSEGNELTQTQELLSQAFPDYSNERHQVLARTLALTGIVHAAWRMRSLVPEEVIAYYQEQHQRLRSVTEPINAEALSGLALRDVRHYVTTGSVAPPANPVPPNRQAPGVGFMKNLRQSGRPQDRYGRRPTAE